MRDCDTRNGLLLAERVARRFLARVDAPNSVSAKPNKTKAIVPGKGSFIVETLDSEDSFPGVIESYSVIDGWMFYVALNGGHGVVGGPQRKLDQWVKDVELQKRVRKPKGKARLWMESDGGKHHVQEALDAAERMFRKGGIRAEIRVWVVPGEAPNGSASGDVFDLVNIHEGGSVSFIGGITLSLPAQMAAHEAAHLLFKHGRSKAVVVGDVLEARESRKEDYLSAYHSLAGHFEGTMEAASLYLLAPRRLEVVAPDVFEAVKAWLG